MTLIPLWKQKLDMLPVEARGRIERYIEEGYGASLSTFYRSVLSNDLIESVLGADEENRAALPAFVEYLTAYAPAECYGSVGALNSWCGLGREDA